MFAVACRLLVRCIPTKNTKNVKNQRLIRAISYWTLSRQSPCTPGWVEERHRDWTMLKWSFKGLPFKHQQWPELIKDAEWWGRETCQVQQKDRKRWTKSRRHYHATSCHHNICHYDLCAIFLLFILLFILSFFLCAPSAMPRRHIWNPCGWPNAPKPWIRAHGGPWRPMAAVGASRRFEALYVTEVSRRLNMFRNLKTSSLPISWFKHVVPQRVHQTSVVWPYSKGTQICRAKRNTLYH